VRGQAVERALQLADAAARHLRELLQHAARERHLALRALVPQDGDPRLVLRQTDVHNQPAREPRHETLIDIRDLGRRAIARHDDLAAASLQRVEDAEHLGLRLAATREKLDVVQ
jgi:hypothetical protein